MKKTIINNIEFTEIEYIYANETEPQIGILVHDLNDINHDGDAIYGNGVDLPKTQDEVDVILTNEHGETHFHIDNGIYYID